MQVGTAPHWKSKPWNKKKMLMFCIARIKAYVSWFPSLAQSTAGDSCMTKVGGVNMELQWGEMNSSTPPPSRINNKGLPISFNQTNTWGVIPTRTNPIILFVSLLSGAEEYNGGGGTGKPLIQHHTTQINYSG